MNNSAGSGLQQLELTDLGDASNGVAGATPPDFLFVTWNPCVSPLPLVCAHAGNPARVDVSESNAVELHASSSRGNTHLHAAMIAEVGRQSPTCSQAGAS